MKYCKDCKVKYNTPLKNCLLCDSKLQFYNNKQSISKFPTYKKKNNILNIFYKLSFLINFISILTVIYIDYTVNKTLSWSYIVVTANIYFIILMTIIFFKLRWISKIILMILLSSGAVIVFGVVIKDYQWALDYVLPFSLLSNLFIITFLLIFIRNKWIDYVAALLLISVLGIVSILMILLKAVVIYWPTLVLFFYSIATIIGLLLFSSKEVKEEFIRRFHI